MSEVERVKKLLAKHADLLNFERVGDYVKVWPIEFLPKPQWDKVNVDVVQNGGEYIGGIGKESHWRFKAGSSQRKVDNLRPLDVAVQRIEENVRELKAKIKELREAGY